MIKGQFTKNLHKAVSERGIKQVELAKVLEVPPTTCLLYTSDAADE